MVHSELIRHSDFVIRHFPMPYPAPKALYPESIEILVAIGICLPGAAIAIVAWFKKRTNIRGYIIAFFICFLSILYPLTREWSERQRAKNACDSYSDLLAFYYSENGHWPATTRQLEESTGFPGLADNNSIIYHPPRADSPDNFLILTCDLARPPYEMPLTQFRQYHGNPPAPLPDLLPQKNATAPGNKK